MNHNQLRENILCL